MAIVSDIEIRLRADIARLQQDMNAARRSVDGGMAGIKKAVESAKSALVGLGVGFSLVALAKQVVDAQREFDKLDSSLVTATGSSKAAAAAFKALQGFAASTPYSVAEATEAFIKLRNLGLTPSERALGSYGNTAAAMGKGLNQMIEAVADAATGEFERLKEFGIKAKQNGDQVMFTFQGVTKAIGNNAKDIEAYLMKIGETDFAGAMERRANTLDGAISNLGDTWSSVMRAISSNGFGEGVMAGVLALSGALTDLSAIIDAVGGAARKEGEQVKEAAGLHAALTTVFETVAVLGLNVAYVVTQVGKELGGLAAQAAAVAKGDFAGAKAIGVAMRAEAEAARVAVDTKSAAILGAAAKAQVVREKEAADIKQSGTDRLAGYAKEISAEEKRNQAKLAILDITNKLNGVDKDTVGNLIKLKTALDTGAISQAEYAKYTAQIHKETALASTAYKDQVKALDMSAEAIKRRAAAQAFANAQDAEHLAFLNRTGQLNDQDFAAQKGADELKTLEQNRTALVAQLALEKKRIDNKAKLADLNGQIAAADKAIDAKKLRNDEAIFEVEQKLYRQAVANTADLIDAARDAARSQQDKTRDMQDEIDMLGLTAEQIAQVTAARLRDQAVALDRRAEIGVIEEVNDALRAQADELRKQADLGLTRARVQEQQKFWGSIEQTAHDTFNSIEDGGAGMWKRLKATGQNIFFEWLYQQTLKKWIISVGASFDGASAVAGLAGSSGSGGASTLSSAGSMAQTASGIYKAISGGFTTLSTTVADAVQAGMYSTGMTTQIASNGAFATGVGTVASIGAGMIGGHYIGNAISGGYSVGDHGQAVVNTATVVGAIVAGPIGAAIGGAIGGLVNRVFGMGEKKYSDTSTLTGSLGAGGFSGTLNTAWSQKGGLFRSDKGDTDKVAVDAAVAGSLSAAYDAIKTASADYAKVLGLNADSIANRAQGLSIALGKDAAANQEAIGKFFAGVGDAITVELLPEIAKFQVEGETASGTLQRLATNFQILDGIFAAIGQNANEAFNVTGVAAIEARERLLQLAGGLDALAAQTTFYYQNFLSDGERVALMQKPLADAMAALGFAGVTTTEQFRAAVDGLVKSGAVATEEGAKQYAGLLALAPQFKTVADYLKQTSDAAAQAAKDLADAAAQAAKDLADAKAELLAQSVQNNADFLQGLVGDTMTVLGRSIDAEKNRITAAFQATMHQFDLDIARVNDTISRTGELSKALKGAITPQPGVDSAARGQAARAEITAALAIAKASGMLPTAASMADALAAVTQASPDDFSTAAEYQRAVARTNAELEALGGMSDDQLDTATRQLQVLQDQKTYAEAAHQQDLDRLDAILASAQAEVDAVNGVNLSVLSVAAALAALQVAITAMSTAPTAGSPGGITTVEDLYRQVLRRAPDEDGYAFWKQAYGDLVDQDEYLDFMKAARPELQGLIKPPPTVSTLPDAMTNTNALLVEMQTLNARMAGVEGAVQSTAASTGQFAQQFHQVSGGGNALATEPI